MSFLGKVENGVVVLPPEANLPDGTAVKIEPVEPALRKLLRLAGTVKNLPHDFAENHDHYLHGTPKRSSPWLRLCYLGGA